MTLLVAACGGEVDRGGEPEDTESTGRESTESTGGPSGDLDLPPCKPGFPIAERDALNACSFLVESLCYETKEAACACACPNRSGTTCVSGFPQHDGAVDVFCD